MLFNSVEFIFFFLPVTLLAFFVAGNIHKTLGTIWLTLASLFFYGWWNPAYLALIVGSMALNFTVGRSIGRAADAGKKNTSKSLLIIGVVANLAILGYFKYFNFFVETINAALTVDINLQHIILPLAISFFTFQQITFLVDSYRGETRDYAFHHYALFVVFFPQLIAGPIVHHKEMMPQFENPNLFRFSARNIGIGLSIFAVGLFKKVVVADSVAVYANPLFSAAAKGADLTFFEAWGGVLAYAFQLYFDFSGYSDMAIGLARMFGIRLPVNFHSPYKATDIVDFWRRWHMTLSRFLRDYVYIPLGGNRKGRVRRHINLMATMLIGGLWHGAGWTFVVWGGLHGLYLVINHAWQSASQRRPALIGSLRNLLTPLALPITFVAVCIAWVFFRATDFASAIRILEAMSGATGFLLPRDYQFYLGAAGDWLAGMGWRFEANAGVFGGASQIGWLVLCAVITWGLPNTLQWFERYRPALYLARRADWGAHRLLVWRPTLGHAAIIAAIGLVAMLSLNRVSEFLYFQF